MSIHIPIENRSTGERLGTLTTTEFVAHQLSQQLLESRVYLRGVVAKESEYYRPRTLFLEAVPVEIKAPVEQAIEQAIVEGTRVQLKGCRGPRMIVTAVDPLWANVVWFDSEDRLRYARLLKSLLVIRSLNT